MNRRCIGKPDGKLLIASDAHFGNGVVFIGLVIIHCPFMERNPCRYTALEIDINEIRFELPDRPDRSVDISSVRGIDDRGDQCPGFERD